MVLYNGPIKIVRAGTDKTKYSKAFDCDAADSAPGTNPAISGSAGRHSIIGINFKKFDNKLMILSKINPYSDKIWRWKSR